MGKKNRIFSMKQKQEESSIEDHDRSEKQLQNLHDLNTYLLKQTMEYRQQIESLVKANDTLEAENTKLNRQHFSVKKSREIKELKRVNNCLESEVNGLREKVTKLENDCIDQLLGEKDDKVRKGADEKNKAFLDLGLEKNLDDDDEAIEKAKAREEYINTLVKMKFTKEYDSLRDENDILRKDIVELKKAMCVLETKLVYAQTIAGPSQIDDLKKEKMEIEMIKCNQKETIMELENKVKIFDEIAQKLTKENKVLHDHVLGLDMNLDLAMEKEKVREEHINVLVKENNSIKRNIEINNVALNEKIVELEKIIEVNGEDLEKLIKELENRYDSLSDENCILKKDIVELKKAKCVLKTKLSDKEKLVEELLSENKIVGTKNESLVREKDALEAELAHYVTENTRLKDELWGSGDENIKLKLEMDVLKISFDRQMIEMSVEVDELVKEKSDREYEIFNLKRELNDMKEKLESESKETSLRGVNDKEVKNKEKGQIKELMSKKMKKKEEILRNNSEKTIKPKTEIKGRDKTKRKELPRRPIWRN